MAERYQLPDGRIAEKTPDGKFRIVSSSPAIGPAIGNDPRIPGALQGQALNNQNAAVNATVNQATQNAQIRQANAQASKAETEARTARIEGGNPGFDREKDLRSAFESDPAVKTYKDAASSLGIMLKTPDTGGGDIQIIYNYIKSQGPGPVAQGELDLAQSVASFRESLEQKYGKLTSSNRLPPRVRRELIEASRQAVAVKKAQFDQVYEQFRVEAARNGLSPEAVTGRHPADAVRPIEEKYIRQHGQTPHSVTGDPVRRQDIEAADPNAKTVTRRNPERSAFIDALVRNGVPFDRAQEAYRQQFPGAPVFSSPEKWEEALDFARRHPNAAGSFGESLDEVPLTAVERANNAFLNTTAGQVATLGVNAMTGGIPTILAGNQGNLAIDEAREDLGTAGSLATEVPGAIAGSLFGGRALGAGANLLKTAPVVGRPATALANNPVARHMAADIGYGGMFGAAEGGPDNRVGGAALGAGAGLLGNQIGSRVLGPGLRLGGQALGYNPAPALPRGQDLIATQTNKADPNAVMGQLQSAADLNMPFALVDAAPQLRSLGGSVVRKSPDAFAIADDKLGARIMGQADRAIGLIDNNLAKSVDVPTFKTNARSSAQNASRDLYKKAEAHPSPDDPELLDILRTPAGEQAARDAYARALNAGEKPADLSFEVDSITGQPRIVGNPNWRTLQYMKFEIDGAAARDPSLEPLRKRFTGRLGALNKDFRAANEAYAGEIGKGDVVQSGYDAFNPRVSPEQLSSGMRANGKNLPLYQQGFASAMSDTVDKTRLAADPYNMVYGSPRQQTKLGQLFPEGAPRFAQARGIESEMSLTNKELFGGSPTAARMESDKLFEGGGMGDIFQAGLEVASGTPPISVARSKLFAGRGAFSGIKDAYNLGVGKSGQQRALEMAGSLFNPDPHATMAALEEMMKAKAARDAYVRRSGMFGSGIGAPLATTQSPFGY